MIKSYAFVDSVKRHGGEFVRPLLLGFLGINLAMVLAFMSGTGFSGSGRFLGFFQQSNGMAAFQSIAFAVSLFALTGSARFLGVVSMPLCVGFLLLSGSRGSLLAIIAMALFYLAHRYMRTGSVSKMAIFLLLAAITPLALVAGSDALPDVANILDGSGFTGLQRIGSLLTALHMAELSEQFQQSRGALNEAALAHFLKHPSLFGSGYESSLELLGMGNRVHNIFLVALVELGVAGFLFFVVVFSACIAMSVHGLRTGGTTFFFSLLFIGVLFQALKTPYYFLNAVSWAVIIFAFSAAPRQRTGSGPDPRQRISA